MNISLEIFVSLWLLETDDCDDMNNSNPLSVVSVVLSEELTLILAEKNYRSLLFILII